MYINNFFLFSLSFLITLLKCENETNEIIENTLEDNYGDDFYGYFKESLKDYLIKNNLFNSDKLIEPNEMKKIFFEVVTEGGPESSPKQLRKIFDKLAAFFVKKYFNEKKQIRGKNIYNLIDINEIYNKFEELLGENPLYGYNEEEIEELEKDPNLNDL